MITQILILTMIWLFTCAMCAVGGFFIGRKAKKKRISVPPSAPADKEEIERFRKEMDNFYSYTGTEQQ